MIDTAAAFPILHAIVGNGHRASRYARMNAPGTRDKYTTVHQALTDAQLREHLLGQSTYAAIVVGHDGLAGAACIELDVDATAGARRVLQAAGQLGVTAFAIATRGAGSHNGSHTWILFAERVQPERAAHLARQIARAAGYSDAEIWPKGNAIRLPFGVHRHTSERGRLILQSGEIYDLQDADQLSMGAAECWALPKNAAPPEVPQATHNIPYTKSIQPAQPRSGRASLDQVKAQFIAEHPLDQLLLGYGAVQTTAKDFSCPFCEHSHTNTLWIHNGRVFSRSPQCKIPQKRGLDAFGLYCQIEHDNDVVAAAKKLNPIEPRRRRQDPPLVEPARRIQTPEQAADAERKRESRRAAAAATLAEVQARASQDTTLSDRAQLVLLALLDCAGARDWCRPSVARLADMIGPEGNSRRTVFYALHELEGRYIRSEQQRGGTTRRTFIRVQRAAAEHGAFAPEFIENIDSIQPEELMRGGDPRGAAETLDQWEACEPDFNPADLDWLYAQAPAGDLPDTPAEPATIAEPDAGGATYSPELDQVTAPRRRAKKSPTERAAAAKARRQAKWRDMEAPELRRQWIVLSRTADKTPNPAQRYALKEQVAEIEHYLALKDARLDRELAPVEVAPPHKLAPEGRPLTLVMDFSQAPPAAAGPPDAYSVIARLKQQRDQRSAVQQ